MRGTRYIHTSMAWAMLMYDLHILHILCITSPLYSQLLIQFDSFASSMDMGPTTPPITMPSATAVEPTSPIPNVGALDNIPSLPTAVMSCLWQEANPLALLSMAEAYTQNPSSTLIVEPSTPLLSSSSGPSSQIYTSLDPRPTISPSIPATLFSTYLSGVSTQTVTFNSVQSPSPSQSQTKTSSSQGSHAISVGLIVGLSLLGVLLAVIVVYFILRRIRRYRAQKPSIYSALPVGSEATVASAVRSFDSGPSGGSSVSAYTKVPHAQGANTFQSMYPQNSQLGVRLCQTPPSPETGLAL
ncbi:hypothetical protein F5J12DRAFT_257672 [Pisolithus orientalis]|uniref:uncharacterized protein n=1 Tax=Pisolithus orientalis TaxID=936130 RepID=UPI0022242F93|nr:uncharacterized protein F5J12DRAFT_257672 [Pisolithus orientalis]KAI6000375.1 hypothetical protein F5J12DRAFT_257672 [Pisolithus orientalis]